MTTHRFPAPEPVTLLVDIGRGSLAVHATDTTEAVVELTTDDPDLVAVQYDDGRLHVVTPRERAGFFGGRDLDVRVVVTVPTASRARLSTRSADIVVRGELGTTEIRSGSGGVHVDQVAAETTVETGSGDIAIAAVDAALRVKTGSGDVRLGRATDETVVSTGSGDVLVDSSHAPLAVKTGSGDVQVTRAGSDVSFSTGSGDLAVQRAERGKVTVKGASGEVRVGVPAGLPVWTDITTASGRIHSTLEGAGEPADGQDHLEVRAKTASGDIRLEQI